MLVRTGGQHDDDKLAALRTIIARRADIQAVDHKQATPLHLAAGTGASWALNALLSAGAERNVPNARGQYPLDCIGKSPSGAVTNKWMYERMRAAGCRSNPDWDKVPGHRVGNVRICVMVCIINKTKRRRECPHMQHIHT